MKRSVVYLLAAGAVISIAAPVGLGRLLANPEHPGWNPDHSRYTLFNGWKLTPAGREIVLPGDMPGSIVLLDGGRKALVNTCGFHDHSLNLVDLSNGAILQTVPFERSWYGLALDSSGAALVSGGQVLDTAKRGPIHRVRVEGNRLVSEPGPALEGIDPKQQFVSGIAVRGEVVFALNIQSDEVVRIAPSGQRRTTLGYRPYGIAVSPDGRELAVSNWGDQSVLLLNPDDLGVTRKIQVEAHPAGLAYLPDGRLLVANAGANTVSVVRDGQVVESVKTGVDPQNRIGSTPVALAATSDGKTVYVANAGDNCVSVLDVSRPGHAKTVGLIPTERYPTAVAVSPDGSRIVVGTAKGHHGPNAGSGVSLDGPGVRGKDYGVPFRYTGNILTGRLEVLDAPDARKLREYTRQVVQNSPAGLAAFQDARERARVQGEAFAKIKHVIYVIRENRTYDQVLGDIAKGNGDPNLNLFGERITPNGHKIANSFVLFDNLYASGEVSQSGHQWTDSAYGNDYTEKQWILNYSGHGEVDSDKRLTSSPGDYIWTAARKKGLWARVYGEYVDVQEDHDSLESEEIKKDPEKYGYSASFEKIFARGGRDTEKVDDFLREMRDAERNGKWPALMVMALPEDHTNGFRAGALSPRAMIANNDYAVGQLVEAVSHSRFWKETAIFIIQDDAQDGPDHVDVHRTVGLVASPYARRGIVDHTMYSTASMLRTMELILGLPPMTQFDAKTTPMYAAFTAAPDFTSYTLERPRVDVNERNPSGTALAKRSARLDFSAVDRADFGELNRILWEGYRPGVPYPGR